MRTAPLGCNKRVPTFATPTLCWRGSLTIGRPSTPGVDGSAATNGSVRCPAVPGHGQQLSVPATRRTLARIETPFEGHLPSPAQLLATDPVRLREAGLSWRKINRLRDLAERLSDGRLNPTILSSLPDDELMAELTAIPGIGPWTVQGRANNRAPARRRRPAGGSSPVRPSRPPINSTVSPSQQEVLDIAEKWRPYRSLATSYLFSAAFERTEASPVVPRET